MLAPVLAPVFVLLWTPACWLRSARLSVQALVPVAQDPIDPVPARVGTTVHQVPAVLALRVALAPGTGRRRWAGALPAALLIDLARGRRRALATMADQPVDAT